MSGEAGRYAVATFRHGYQDYDQPKVSPWVEALDQEALAAQSATPPMIQYFDHLDEVSAPGADQHTPTMTEIAAFQSRFGKTAQFYEAVRQFHSAMQKAGSSKRYEWFEWLSGGGRRSSCYSCRTRRTQSEVFFSAFSREIASASV